MFIKKVISQLLIFSFFVSSINVLAFPEKGSALTVAQVKELQNQLTLLKADKSLSESKIESFEEQIEKLIEDNEKLKKEVEKLKGKNEKLKCKKEKLKKKIKKLSSTDANPTVTAIDNAVGKITKAYFWNKYGPAIFAGGILTVFFVIALIAAIFDL